jgi:hypothetical protein
MSALAVATPNAGTHPASVRPGLSGRSRIARLRPVPDVVDAPVTVTISVGGGGHAGRERVLAALRDLVSVAGTEVEVSAVSAPAEAGAVRLDPRSRSVQHEGRLLDVSRLEFDLLLFLARNPQQVFSRSQLLAQVWGHTHTTARTVDVHVSRLRTKLNGQELITTVYGIGYRLADAAPLSVME